MTALVCTQPELQAAAQAVAQTLDFTLLDHWPESEDYQLLLNHTGLSLARTDKDKNPVQVDFCAGANAHRRRFGGGKGQDIAKAVGIGKYVPSVADLTAGLGRDAFVLASLGCQVTALERHPVVAALLADGLRRAGHADLPDVWSQLCKPVSDESDRELSVIINRIQLQHKPAVSWLIEQSDDAVDVIYLDPMFAHDGRQKAQVKKDMQAFRSLVGADDDADALLQHALRVARCRCVVKRARKAPPLDNQAPSYSLVGKANRFDVYALAKVEAP